MPLSILYCVPVGLGVLTQLCRTGGNPFTQRMAPAAPADGGVSDATAIPGAVGLGLPWHTAPMGLAAGEFVGSLN